MRTQTPFALNSKLVELVLQKTQPGTRAVVLGSTGWLGRTSSLLLAEAEIPTLHISSRAREFTVAGSKFHSEVFKLKEIEKFEPNLIIDAAYVTREFANENSLENYCAVNRQLVQNTLDASKLSSVTKVISFSSGAATQFRLNAKPLGIAEDPYGYLKNESEKILQAEFGQSGITFSIPRVWSISGSLVAKVNGFAFSDLICQAEKGRIQVSSQSKVHRRYCLAEEVIGVALISDQCNNRIFDTGGPLVEVRELATIVAARYNNRVPVDFSEPSGDNNDYYSDNLDWESACSELNYESLTIGDQVEQVASYFRQQNICT